MPGITPETQETLINAAIQARDMAYTPYSGFKVGAALLTNDLKIYKGCNIENAAYTPTNCAERTAFFKAVSEGERRFAAIAIAGWQDGKPPGLAYPCGVCRQVMMEFTNPDDFWVIVAASKAEYNALLLRELLPLGFGPANLL
ncbi:MAG: cytidine deaminase [Clostridiales bacterium]|jgi:cytidine deaminase|nr:cytidine deaminase [Clostridiales bacterium]